MKLSVVLSLCLAASALAQTIGPPKPKQVYPMEVDLMHGLNAASAKVGDDIVSKLRQDWTDGTCMLARGALVHGKIVTLEEIAGRHQKMAVAFLYGCDHVPPQKLVLIALLAPDTNDLLLDSSGNPVTVQSFRSSSFGGSGNLGSDGISARIDMSGRQNAALPLFTDDSADRKVHRPTAVKTGQVWHLPKLKLEVGSGPEGSTTLASSEKQVRVPGHAVMVLLPESAALLPEAGTPAKVAAAPKRVMVPLPPEIGACAQPACTDAGASSAAMAEAPLRTISLQRLGYRRLKTAEMRDLEFAAASAFLGEDHLLFAFDPHSLVSREKEDRPEDHPHMIRAVLFNLKSGRVERTLDWRVRSDEQYMWVVDGEHVLVHDGDRLRWMGAGMHEERSIKLEGPLAFVRMSPDRRHYAIGVTRELHTRDDHAGLLKEDANGPEEQVAVQMLDEHLKEIDEGLASSRALPPVLLNRGRVELRRGQGGHWYLREYAWDGGQPRDFARMNSSCMPKLKGLSTDLLLAEGCEGAGNDHWYRVFREDGAPVLKGVVHWREFSPLTAEDSLSGTFALAVAEGGGDYVRESVFHGGDLSRETVRVHRASDGHELFATRMRFPLPANQPVSFSPGGERIAVIDGDEIAIYAIGGAREKVARR